MGLDLKLMWLFFVPFQAHFTNGTSGLGYNLVPKNFTNLTRFLCKCLILLMFHEIRPCNFTNGTEHGGMQKAKLLFLLYILLYSYSFVPMFQWFYRTMGNSKVRLHCENQANDV